MSRLFSIKSLQAGGAVYGIYLLTKGDKNVSLATWGQTRELPWVNFTVTIKFVHKQTAVQPYWFQHNMANFYKKTCFLHPSINITNKSA